MVLVRRGSKAFAKPGLVSSNSLKVDPGMEAIRQLVRASTLAERGPPSIAGNSPKVSPVLISRKLTALPTVE
jgi:hypothetical protein